MKLFIEDSDFLRAQFLLFVEPWAAAKKALRYCSGATSSCPGSGWFHVSQLTIE